MGRGRAKAKQAKVARELKYHSPNTDLTALQRELSGTVPADDESDEEYLDGADEDVEAESDDGSWATRSR